MPNSTTFPQFQGEAITISPSFSPWEPQIYFLSLWLLILTISSERSQAVHGLLVSVSRSACCELLWVLACFSPWLSWSRYYSLLWIYPMQLAYSSARGYLGHFDFGYLCITKLQTFEYKVAVWKCVLILWDLCLGAELQDCGGSSV